MALDNNSALLEEKFALESNNRADDGDALTHMATSDDILKKTSNNVDNASVQGGNFAGMSLDYLFATYAEQMKPLKEKYGHVVDEILIFRFLSGHDFDVEKCDKLIEESLKFRKEKNLDTIQAEAIRQEQMEFPAAVKLFECMPHVISYGFTKDGSPLSIDRSGMIEPQLLVDTCSLEELELYTLYHLENKMHVLNELSRKTGKLVQGYKILDLTGLGMKHVHTKALGYMRHMTHAGQANYPEMLDKMIIVNVPAVFTAVWRLIKGMLQPRTQSKIILLGSDYQEELKKIVDADQLPSWLDGTRPGNDLFMEYGSASALRRVNVPRGSVVEKTFEISSNRSARVEWEVTCDGDSFDFEVQFRGASVDSVVKHKGLHKGGLDITESGTLIVKLDNKGSRLKSKDFQYRIQTFLK
eukprot:TRINITY_DN1001_c0_g1_i1.p1 TRINITY_DN1001_c0_g1~~TRINITY_DN1001_c0_g1_i1.p1  ORF type:complete len:413 (-),score=111.76 TRINITY_DN1001_c0_g1_i1:31-1269(-)